MADLSLVFDLLARDRASAPVEGVGDAFDQAGSDAESFGSGVSDVFSKVVAGAALAGAGIAAGFAEALSRESEAANLSAQLGLSPEESATAGKLAGSLFAGNYGDSFEQVNEAIGAVRSSITGLGDLSSSAMEEATQTRSISPACSGPISARPRRPRGS